MAERTTAARLDPADSSTSAGEERVRRGNGQGRPRRLDQATLLDSLAQAEEIAHPGDLPLPFAAPAILHVRIEDFALMVALGDRPDLQGCAVVVSGDTEGRGAAVAVSAAARAEGIVPGMRLGVAEKLCPNLIVLPLDPISLRAAAREALEGLGAYTPLIEPEWLPTAKKRARFAMEDPVRLARCFGVVLDVRGCERLFGPPPAIAEQIAVDLAVLGYASRIGMAGTPALAAVASILARPGTPVQVPTGQERAFLEAIPLTVLEGLDPDLRDYLRGLGVTRAGQLAKLPSSALRRRFGAAGRAASEHAHGLTDRPVIAPTAPPTLEAAYTPDDPITDGPRLDRELSRLAGRLARDLAARGQAASRITLTVTCGNRGPRSSGGADGRGLRSPGRDGAGALSGDDSLFSLIMGDSLEDFGTSATAVGAPSECCLPRDRSRGSFAAGQPRTMVSQIGGAGNIPTSTTETHTDPPPSQSCQSRDRSRPVPALRPQSQVRCKPSGKTLSSQPRDHSTESSHTRCLHLKQPVAGAPAILARLRELLIQIAPDRPSAALRIELAELSTAPIQLSFPIAVGIGAPRQERLDVVAQRLRERFGPGAARRAHLVADALLPEDGVTWEDYGRLPTRRPRPIAVQMDAEGRPAAVRRGTGSWEEVRAVYTQWRIRTKWWAEPTHRHYYRVETARGAVVDVYHEQRDGRWHLAATKD